MFNFLDFDKLFNFNEDYNWDDLKSKGKITEVIEEKDGFKTITKTFISFDKKERITSVESFPIINKTKQKIKEIEDKIKIAIKEEKYEEAAILKKEKEKLTKNKK